MSDDRDDATPEPEDGSSTGDSAVSPAADDPQAESGTAGQEVAAVARPAGKRRGSAGPGRAPGGARRDADTTRPGSKGRATPARSKQEAPSRGNPAARIVRYLREVVAELRKVIWPTRSELITYTAVVLAFVTVMVALTSGADLGFARAVLLVFG